MNKNIIKKPFSQKHLSEFILAPNLLPFTDKEIIKFDKELSEYEQVLMNPDIEKNLISKNELLASFAISKAEQSSLTLQEAQDVYELILKNQDYDFIQKKIQDKKNLTQKDYEKLEFFNIARTFRKLNQDLFTIDKLTPKFIKDIHLQLTQGLDIFHDYLADFTVYKSGKWRGNDSIRVGTYIPLPCKIIQKSVKELTTWLKNTKAISNVGVFHTALYALHPFNNGNKRVCRVLEHLLLRNLGINSKNLYSTSYYYHKQKDRYYKYLLYSLERKNLNHFTAFVLEAIVLSIVSVLKTSLEAKRAEFLTKTIEDAKSQTILKPLIKRREMQFKALFKFSKKKIARQTFVSYLQKAVKNKLISRREHGRAVYYGLNFQTQESAIMQEWLSCISQRLSYIPDDIKLCA